MGSVCVDDDGREDDDDEDDGVRLAILLQQALPHPDLQQNDGEKHGIIIIQVSSNTFFNAKWVQTSVKELGIRHICCGGGGGGGGWARHERDVISGKRAILRG